MAELDARRARLVRKAAGEWTNALIDLGGRNNLLHYRELKLGTLDLAAASEDAVTSLLGGATIRISSMFRTGELREQALRRVRAIHKKAVENSEERGLKTVSIGCGLATWENPRGKWAPSAPVLLQSASLVPIGASQDDFECALTGELEVSPTLLYALKTGFGCEFDQEALMARIDGSIDEPWELREAYKWVTERASAVPGFRVDEALVLANFAYAKLEMVRDLESSLDQLTGHDLIAALAGDEQARAAIRAQGPGPDAVLSPDQVPLADEFLVLDADSSQNYAINAVLGGRHLIIKGPPGTGKSQTISNLIASLAARGERVLFVAEKRAAIEAVTKRLNQRGLGGLVLDMHGGVTSKREFAQSVGAALDGIKSTPLAGNASELADIEARREQLNSYVRAMRDPRMPWDLSVYEMRSELTGMLGMEGAAPWSRLPRERVAGMGREAFATIKAQLQRYADLGGMTLAQSPWANSPVTTESMAQQADDVLGELLGTDLPAITRLVGHACQVTGTPLPPTLADIATVVSLWAKVAAMQWEFSPAIYDLDLRAERAALAPAERGGIVRLWASLFSGAYRAARTRVRAAALAEGKAADRALASAVAAAQEIAGGWARLGVRGGPRAPGGIGQCALSYQKLSSNLATLEAVAGRFGLSALPVAECQRVLSQLEADRATLGRLPELRRLRASLDAAGLGQLIGELTQRQAPPGAAVRVLRYAYLRSILDQLAFTDLEVGAFSGEAHQRMAEEFAAGDRKHIDVTPARVRRAHAERVVRVLDAHPEQVALVRHQAALKRRHRPVRDFVRSAADVLLAVKPCWAMSPLVVSQLLPAHPYFDVVIFDEASQVTPADAVTSIMRGKQLVVAGDDKQLPPTAFFASASPGDEDPMAEEADEEDAPLIAGTAGFESILDALHPVLGFRMLTWHYRSRDEQLIAFSNEHIYDRMLTTFPGVGGDRVLDCVAAPWTPGASTNSPSPEVTAVVDLIFEHAREHPDESLGIITMGITHSTRVEEALRQRLRDDPGVAGELGDFFDESREERFFVKNIERVQGDERDAIILSIGYGKDANGKLPYRFGPLLTEGGERRLNVAVTRARTRLTLVSSFSSHDMDPERSAARGVQLLRQYLQYVESGGTHLGDQSASGARATLNPFEADVRDTLAARGLRLTPQYGTSGYWIDFAVQHPEQPGRHVLAIECDGASYHSSPSARDRDRLRQEHLERLGWRFHRIWSSDWFTNKEACANAAVAAYERALSASAADDAGRLADGGTRGHVRSEPITTSRMTGSIHGQASAPRPQREAALNPRLLPGLPVTEYSDRELWLLALWIRSDGVLRTEDELMAEMMRELGFQKRGSRITSKLSQAIAQTRP